MTVYGEDGVWFHDGVPIRGSEPESPPKMDRLKDGVILRSGFALRDDDKWKLAVLVDLSDYRRCAVARIIDTPLSRLTQPSSSR